MSGHSKWSTIKREKGAKDAKRGAIFTKIGNLIAIAARKGTDPVMNSALAMAIEKAKSVNMPAANIQRAIDRVSDKNAAQLEELTYEAIGPGGVGIIIETATDNRNRTFPEIKSMLTKNGARIADAGSVMFQFSRKGVIRVKNHSEETLLTALECGADDASEDGEELVIYTDQKYLAKVRENLMNSGIEVLEADLQYVPNQLVSIENAETSEKILKILELIDDHDDVVNVYTNADLG